MQYSAEIIMSIRMRRLAFALAFLNLHATEIIGGINSVQYIESIGELHARYHENTLKM